MSDVKARPVEWVRDGAGVAHAARESAGDCHSAQCGRFVRGVLEKLQPRDWAVPRCPACCDRMERRVIEGGGKSPPRAVLQGHGVQAELGRQRKGRKRNDW